MKEKLNKEFLDLRRFENPINSIDLIKSITSNPTIENDPFYIVDLEDICNKHINCDLRQYFWHWCSRIPSSKLYWHRVANCIYIEFCIVG